MLYETLPYANPDFKILYSKNSRLFDNRLVWAHWHESIECIYIHEGDALIHRNGIEQLYHPGDFIVFRSNEIHSIQHADKQTVYDYLIIDLSVCNIGNLPMHTNNPHVISLFQTIMDEFSTKTANYREAVIGACKLMMALLSREGNQERPESASSRKKELVKTAIDYMSKHFQENISLADISHALHVSKHYLCHTYKDVTGMTLLTHLNFIRCDHARSLITSGKYSVTESAYASGFSNLAHFTQTYKKQFRTTPSADIKRFRC